MSTETSIGPEGNRGNNEDVGNADGCGNKTLGTHATDQPPTAADGMDQAGTPDVPAGVPGSKPKPGIAKGPQSYPDGPNVESSPWELEAARGKLPKDR